MNKKIRSLLILIVVMGVPTLLFAQPCVDCDSEYGVTDVQVPFDDGVYLLIAAAIGYVLLRLWGHKRNEKFEKGLLRN